MIQRAVCGVLRSVGRGLDVVGQSLEMNPHIDRLQPSTRNMKFRGVSPALKCSFIAPSASVMGKVTIGPNSSIWYDAVVRGDINDISIGESVSVGERAMIHVSGNLKKSAPTNIGNRVIIGVGANVHGCTLEDECEIGDMAQVLDGAVVKKHSKIAPGSVVTPGTVVPPRQLWAGIPAKFQREMTSAEINRIGHLVAEQAEFAKAHAIECSKGWEQIFEEDFALEEKRQTGSYFYQPLSEKAIAVKLGEFEGHQIPGRILNSEMGGYNDPDHRGGSYEHPADDNKK